MNLISLAIPDDAVDGAPLVFDSTAPGRCRWANAEVVGPPGGAPAGVNGALRELANELQAEKQKLARLEHTLDELVRFRDAIALEAARKLGMA